MQGFYDNQIKDLQKEIAELQKKVEVLTKKQQAEKYRVFEFTDKQINDAAVQLIVERASESDFDIDILDNFKDEIWSPAQLKEYCALNVEDQDEALWTYVDLTRKRVKVLLDELSWLGKWSLTVPSGA